MKDFFPESLGQKCGCALYTGEHCTGQNTVVEISGRKKVQEGKLVISLTLKKDMKMKEMPEISCLYNTLEMRKRGTTALRALPENQWL